MFLTGEFSRMARISRQMLQHLQPIGLFCQQHTDPQTGCGHSAPGSEDHRGPAAPRHRGITTYSLIIMCLMFVYSSIE